MNRRRILIIHHTLGGGGAERALVTFLQQFNRRCWHITLLLLGGGELLQEVPEDVEVKVLRSVRGDEKLPVLATWLRVINARKLLKGRVFDLTLSFMEGPSSMVHSRIMDIAPRTASWVHCDLEANRWYKWSRKVEKAYYASVDRCASVSDSVAQSLKNLYGVDSQVVANPIDTVSIRSERARASKGEGFRVAFVGRLVEVKRPEAFLQALAMLRGRGIDAKGVIVGEGSLESELRAAAISLGLSDYIEWYGFTRSRFSLMAECHALCISSRSEGRSLVADEAAALGLPVICTPVGGVAERLGDWCLPVGFDAASIAGGLEKVARGEWTAPDYVYEAPGIGQIESFLESLFEQ